MSLAEGVSARVSYKFYSSGAMTSNLLADKATDPAASGGQIMRRVTSTLKLQKDIYQSAEVRGDRQILDLRHGKGSVAGSISGEWSPGTYKDWFEAGSRGTWAAAVTSSQADFTSIAADNSTSKFIFASGDPVSKGFRVGMICRAGSTADTDNSGKNFVITGFGGTSNRNVSVFPAPDTMSPDAAFTFNQIGKGLIVPSSNFVKRKVLVEHYHSDIDMTKVFLENRVAGFNLGLPATGMATIEFPVMGRAQEVLSGGSSPFFASPGAEGTEGIFAAVNGLLRVGGSTVGVVTGITAALNLSPSGDAVVGQNFVPEIFLGRANMTGQFTVELEDGTFLEDFQNEEELDLLCYLTVNSDVNSPAATLYLPRIKLTGADNPAQGEGGQIVTCPFQALKSTAVESTSGIASTTFQICDTDVV